MIAFLQRWLNRKIDRRIVLLEKARASSLAEAHNLALRWEVWRANLSEVEAYLSHQKRVAHADELIKELSRHRHPRKETA